MSYHLLEHIGVKALAAKPWPKLKSMSPWWILQNQGARHELPDMLQKDKSRIEVFDIACSKPGMLIYTSAPSRQRFVLNALRTFSRRRQRHVFFSPSRSAKPLRRGHHRRAAIKKVKDIPPPATAASTSLRCVNLSAARRLFNGVKFADSLHVGRSYQPFSFKIKVLSFSQKFISDNLKKTTIALKGFGSRVCPNLPFCLVLDFARSAWRASFVEDLPGGTGAGCARWANAFGPPSGVADSRSCLNVFSFDIIWKCEVLPCAHGWWSKSHAGRPHLRRRYSTLWSEFFSWRAMGKARELLQGQLVTILSAAGSHFDGGKFAVFHDISSAL